MVVEVVVVVIKITEVEVVDPVGVVEGVVEGERVVEWWVDGNGV